MATLDISFVSFGFLSFWSSQVKQLGSIISLCITVNICMSTPIFA